MECPGCVGRWAGVEVLPPFFFGLEDGWRSVDDGCKTRFISCRPSADHRSTVTKKNEQSRSLKKLTLVSDKFKT